MPDNNAVNEPTVYDAANVIEDPVTTAENTPEDAAILEEASALLSQPTV